jgi:transposase
VGSRGLVERSVAELGGRLVFAGRQELDAVVAGLSQEWSTGPVEGQINRLKMLKRQMYGRAGMSLLLAWVLPSAAAA